MSALQASNCSMMSWIFHDVDVEPQDPILVAQRAEQKMVARPRQHGAALGLKDGAVARLVVRHDEAEILLQKDLAAEARA
jgi:hypothetical protein